MIQAMNIRLAGNWGRMTIIQKLSYLVDTKQAQNFSDAGKMLASIRKQKHQPFGLAAARAMRLPYADN